MAITRAARKFWAKASSQLSRYRVPPSFECNNRSDISPFPTQSTVVSLDQTSFLPRFSCSKSRLYLPLGPLFLRSPTWRLSQFATPLSPPRNFGLGGGVRKEPVQATVNRHLRLPGIRVGVEGAPVSPVVRLEIKRTSDGGGADSLFNPPNLISISRMLSGPLVGWLIINDQYYPALVGLVLAGASDWLDGYVARKMKINSVLGSYLDPFADKVLIISVVIAMIQKDLLSTPLVALVVARDLSLIGGAIYKRASSLGWKWKNWKEFLDVDKDAAERVEPLFISKVNTVLQLGLVGVAILQPEIGTDGSLELITWLSWAVAATTLASGASYGLNFLQKGRMTT